MNAYKYWQNSQRLQDQFLGKKSPVDISVFEPDQPGPVLPDPTELNAEGQPVNGPPEQIGVQLPIAVPLVIPGDQGPDGAQAAGVEEGKQMEPPPDTAPAQPKPVSAVVPSRRTGSKKPEPNIPPEAFANLKREVTRDMLCEVIINTTDYNIRDLDGKHMSTLRKIIVRKNLEQFPDSTDVTDQDIDDFVINWFDELKQKRQSKQQQRRSRRQPDRLVEGKGEGQEGNEATLSTIDNEGMSTDDIENVVEKKTHRLVHVIASDQIPTLSHFVGPKTKSFGFVINSQDHKKAGKHWRAIFRDHRTATVSFYVSLVSQTNSLFPKVYYLWF